MLPHGVDANGVPKSTPTSYSVKYVMNAVGILNGLPHNYQSKESDDSLLAAINSAITGGTITKEWDSTNSKYVYTYTPDSEPAEQTEP